MPGCSNKADRNRLGYCKRHWDKAVSSIKPLEADPPDDEYTEKDLEELGIKDATPIIRFDTPDGDIDEVELCECNAYTLSLCDGVLELTMQAPSPEFVATLVSALLEQDNGDDTEA